MKKHNGMRPHDIVILLKIAAKGDAPWLMKDFTTVGKETAYRLVGSTSFQRNNERGACSLATCKREGQRAGYSALTPFSTFCLPARPKIA